MDECGLGHLNLSYPIDFKLNFGKFLAQRLDPSIKLWPNKYQPFWEVGLEPMYNQLPDCSFSPTHVSSLTILNS